MVSWQFAWGFAAGCTVCMFFHWIGERIAKRSVRYTEDELAETLREIGDGVPCINKYGFCPSCSARAALERAHLPVTSSDRGTERG